MLELEALSGIELSARFYETVLGFEIEWLRGRPHKVWTEDGWTNRALLPDLAAEHELGRVVRLVQERWPRGGHEMGRVWESHGRGQHYASVALTDGDWLVDGWAGQAAEKDNPGLALMLAACAAAEGKK